MAIMLRLPAVRRQSVVLLNLAIRVYDVGNITATEQVAVTVTHP
jgi:hypothetical protein